MIPVRIAANLTPTGTDGVRWVLVDDADTAACAAEPAAPPPLHDEVRPRRRAAPRWIKLAVLCAGLAGAAATTRCIVDQDRPASPHATARVIEPTAAR